MYLAFPKSNQGNENKIINLLFFESKTHIFAQNLTKTIEFFVTFKFHFLRS